MSQTFYEIPDDAKAEFDNYTPPSLAKDGEYKVRIKDFSPDKNTQELVRFDKNGMPFVTLILEIEDTETHFPIRHNVYLQAAPGLGTPDLREMSVGKYKQFLAAFGMPWSNRIEFRAWIGKQASAFIRTSPAKDGFDERNEISRWSKTKSSNEATTAAPETGRKRR